MLNATQLVWDGWGGGMITFLWTCTHVESSLENLCLCLYVPTKCGQCMA